MRKQTPTRLSKVLIKQSAVVNQAGIMREIAGLRPIGGNEPKQGSTVNTVQLGGDPLVNSLIEINKKQLRLLEQSGQRWCGLAQASRPTG